MKRYIAYTLFIITLIAGCKKDKSNGQGKQKLYPVTFSVAGVNQTVKTNSTGGKLAVNALADSTQKLYYKILSSGYQTSLAPGFGIIRDSVPAGTYNVVLIKSRGNLQVFTITFQSDSDTFAKVFPITVSNGPVNANVTLERVNAKLEVNLEDAIPANVTGITVTITSDANSMYIYQDFKPYDLRINTLNRAVTPADVGKTNFKISGVVFNTNTPFTVTIKPTGSGNYPAKTVTGVTCQRNTKTTLTGKLFSNPTAGFNININQSFDTDSLKTGF